MTSAEELYAIAKSSLPGWLFGPEESAHLLAVAKLLGGVFDLVKARVSSTYLTAATTEWLNEHAKDRGTSRQTSENDSALADRLRYAEDAVTPAALVASANRLLVAAGIATSAAVAELRQPARMFMKRQNGMHRGWRMGISGPAGNKIIIILPYGTPVGVQNAVAEAVRLRRAGGVSVIVELRGVP